MTDHNELRAGENDRLSAALEAKTQPTREAVAKELYGHWLHDDTKNLGYYRTEARCECGAVLWWGQGHEDDPTSSDVWYGHLADAVLALLGEANTNE